MINIQEQDYSRDLQFNNDNDAFRPFRHSPITKQLDIDQHEKSDILDISASLQDFSHPQVMEERKMQNTKTSLKIFGLLKVDKLVQVFKERLMRKAYVYNNKSKKVTDKFIIEKYLLKKPTMFSKYLHTKKCQIPVFDQSSMLITFWEFIRTLSLISILWVYPFVWSFEMGQENSFQFIVLYTLIYFSLDILLRLNTQIAIQGNIINDRFSILKQYFKDDLVLSNQLFKEV